MKSQEMYFSVIVPLYNKAAYITKTIRSVLSQTHPDFEVLIVDDGSTDNSLDVVKAITDKRITIIFQENKGVSAARNTGIKAAKYNLIALLDADDWWDETYLEEMLGLIRDYPAVSLYCSQFASVFKGKIFPIVDISQKTDCFDGFQEGIQLKHLPVHTSATIIKKEVLQQSGLFDERISLFEDHDLYIRISLFSKWAYINKKPLVFYNLDVPENQRITGMPVVLEKHLLFYTDKFEAWYADNPYLPVFMKIFILNYLYDLRHCPGYQSFKRKKLKNIPLGMFSCKQMMKFYFPVFLTDAIRKIYLMLKRGPK